MSDVRKFLRARYDEQAAQLDEDEETALGAAEHAAGAEWLLGHDGQELTLGAPGAVDDDNLRVAEWTFVVNPARPDAWDDVDDFAQQHVARHDPARVLDDVARGRRDLAAKRAIVDELAIYAQRADPLPDVPRYVRGALQWVAAHLADEFADHPDHDPAWSHT